MLTFMISCLFFSVVRALPTLLSRDVFDPPIISPSASTIWQVGQTVTVIWDITNLPPASQLTDPNGTVVLGYMVSSTDSEHLMIDSPLAQDFPLSDGNVSFIVPSVVTRSDYIIALFGDSGNISPTFTIEGTESSSSAPTTSTSASIPLSTSSSISVPTSFSSSTLQTTVVTEAEASSSASHLTSESSATNTVTSVITVSSGPASSTTAEIGSASSLSISSTSGSSASPSATEAAASSNSAWRPGVSQSQVYAFVVAGLLAACLL